MNAAHPANARKPTIPSVSPATAMPRGAPTSTALCRAWRPHTQAVTLSGSESMKWALRFSASVSRGAPLGWRSMSASGLSTGAILVASAAVVAFVVRTWLVAKIQEKAKEDVRWRALRRERAAALANFLGLWVAGAYDPTQRNNVRLLEVQRSYWELALWLDDETLRTLNRALIHDGDHNDALIQVRAVLHAPESVDLKSSELIRWRALTAEGWAADYPAEDHELPTSPVDVEGPGGG